MMKPSWRVFYSERLLLDCGDVSDLAVKMPSWKAFDSSRATPPTRP